MSKLNKHAVNQSFLLNFKNIAPYLPYGLRIKHVTNGNIFKAEGIHSFYEDGTFIYYWDKNYGTINQSSSYIPILKPLSDLGKEEEFKNYYFSFDEKDGFMIKRINENYTRFEELLFLFENHFDVFGLIQKGLAISIHDVE